MSATLCGFDFVSPSDDALVRVIVARFVADPTRSLAGLRAAPLGLAGSAVRISASLAALTSPETAPVLLRGGLFEQIVKAHKTALAATPSSPSGLAWQLLPELVDLVDPLIDDCADLLDSPSLHRADLEAFDRLWIDRENLLSDGAQRERAPSGLRWGALYAFAAFACLGLELRFSESRRIVDERDQFSALVMMHFIAVSTSAAIVTLR